MFQKKPAPEFEYFTVHDTKTGSYREPVMAVNRHDLLREISNIFNDPQKRLTSQYFLNAEDFQIFKIGEYSKSTGVITPCQPEHVANFHDLKSATLRAEISRNAPVNA